MRKKLQTVFELYPLCPHTSSPTHSTTSPSLTSRFSRGETLNTFLPAHLTACASTLVRYILPSPAPPIGVSWRVKDPSSLITAHCSLFTANGQAFGSVGVVMPQTGTPPYYLCRKKQTTMIYLESFKFPTFEQENKALMEYCLNIRPRH